MEYIYSENKSGRRYVKASVIAQYYDITPPTVYRWANEGRIPSMRFENTIRFNFEAVKAAIEGVPVSPPREEPPEIEEQIEALRSRNFEEQAALAEGEEVVR
jgi:excisionase family DNA binding protein